VCAQRYLTGTDALPFISVSTATNANGSDTDAIDLRRRGCREQQRQVLPLADGFWIYNLDTRTALNGRPLVTARPTVSTSSTTQASRWPLTVGASEEPTPASRRTTPTSERRDPPRSLWDSWKVEQRRCDEAIGLVMAAAFALAT
jgi:hypothetical protein